MDGLDIYYKEQARVETDLKKKLLSDSYRWHRLFVGQMYRYFSLGSKPSPITIRFDNSLLDRVVPIHAAATYRPAKNGLPAEIILANYSLSADDGWMNFLQGDSQEAFVNAISSLRQGMPTSRELETMIRATRFYTLHETGHYLHNLSNPLLFSSGENVDTVYVYMITQMVAELAALIHASRFGFLGNCTITAAGESDMEGAHRIFRSCKNPEAAVSILERLVKCRTLDEALSIDAFRVQYDSNFETIRDYIATSTTPVTCCGVAEPKDMELVETQEYIESLQRERREENRRKGSRR